MDIEEERPSDTSDCGNPSDSNHRPCPPGQNRVCEWDYLEITADRQRSPKMCQYVNKFRKFAIQNGIPGTPDYSYFFKDYNYQSDPMFYNVIDDGWFKGKVFDSNLVMVEFKSDNGANFYGFDLVWKFSKGKPQSNRPTRPPAVATTTAKTTTTTPDPDQCSLGTHTCSDQATCINTDEGFRCACFTGFEGNGHTCTDINECNTGANVCSIDSNCINKEGSFDCECKSGFFGNGVVCHEVDECEIGADDCNDNALCINTKGSFACRCKQGYRGDGVRCDDIDECSNGQHTCDSNAKCINTDGSFTCVCDKGFTGNGISCQDIDECKSGHNCSPFATCRNTIGGFGCQCIDGFAGSGQVCLDINECANGSHSCDESALVQIYPVVSIALVIMVSFVMDPNALTSMNVHPIEITVTPMPNAQIVFAH